MENLPETPGQTLLYKYRSLDTDEQIEFVRDLLVKHRLYCAGPRSFNDPFECRAQISFDAPMEVKIQSGKVVEPICKEQPGICLPEAEKLVPARCAEFERNGPQNVEKKVFDELGIVSMAGTLNSPLMWSHYAAGHTGLCIEFCAHKQSQLDFFGSALPVRYQKDLPIIDFYRDKWPVIVEKYLLTKAVDWSYEKEWRIMQWHRNTNQYYDFNPALIRKVLLGLRISQEHSRSVRSFVDEIPRDVRPVLCGTKRSDSAYTLEFEQIQ